MTRSDATRASVAVTGDAAKTGDAGTGAEPGDESWMAIALDEARVAGAAGDVPIGCVIVRDGVVIGQGANRRERDRDPTAHAEIVALRDAASHVNAWRLLDAVAYVTLEPCPMCAGALVNARVRRVVYACADPKAGAVDTLLTIGRDARFNHRFESTANVLEQEAAELLRAFFRQRRGPREP